MKKFSEKDIPQEVKEYMAIVAGTGGLMGLKLYRKCKTIEEKYPEWFPWEHKYNSIPQEVHDAYRNEQYSSTPKPNEISKEAVSFSFNDKSLLDALNKWQESLINEQRIKAEQLKKDKELWDKHYKKYGLEFRD